MARVKKIEEPSLDEATSTNTTELTVSDADATTDTGTEITVEEPSLDEDADEAEATSPEEIVPAPAPAPVAGPREAHVPIGSKAHAMKLKLAGEPKVRVFIPLAPGEKQGVTQSVILNGYPMYIRKGSYVDVPQSVAEVLEVKLKHKMSIENHPNRITGEGDVPMTAYGN